MYADTNHNVRLIPSPRGGGNETMNTLQMNKGAAIALFLLLFGSYAYFTNPPNSDLFNSNELVRFLLTKSIALDRSVTIGRYSTAGIDMAFDRGHYFSGKAPGLSFAAVPLYAFAFEFSGGDLPDSAALYFVRIFALSLPAALIAVMLLRFVLRIGSPLRPGLLLITGYGLGTIAFPYSILFVGHQLGAILCVCSFLTILRWRREGERNIALALLSGLLGGMAVLCEYPAALLILIIALYAFYPFGRIGQAGAFVLGLVPGALAVLGYNWICFGDPLSFPYAHEAMPVARQVQTQGLFGLKIPKLVPFVKLLFSPWRGIFFTSPFLILCIPGYFYMLEKSTCEADENKGSEFKRLVGIGRKRLFAVSLTVSLCYILLNSSYLAWSGGAAYGPRLLIPAIPFLLIPIAYLFAARPRRYLPLAAILVTYSVLFNVVAIAGGPLAHEYLRNPVREASAPYFFTGNIYSNWGTQLGLRGLPSLIPLAVFWIVMLGIMFRPEKGPRVERAAGEFGAGERIMFISVCLIAGLMILLFFVHRTDENAYRYAVIGHGFDVRGDSIHAEEYFEKSLSMDPNNRLVLMDYSAIALRRGNYRLALDLRMRLLKLEPANSELMANIKTLMELTGVVEALGHTPNDAELRSERRLLMEKLGLVPSDQ
jgi:tetratricopeptide (TPR) repeat protein